MFYVAVDIDVARAAAQKLHAKLGTTLSTELVARLEKRHEIAFMPFFLSEAAVARDFIEHDVAKVLLRDRGSDAPNIGPTDRIRMFLRLAVNDTTVCIVQEASSTALQQRAGSHEASNMLVSVVSFGELHEHLDDHNDGTRLRKVITPRETMLMFAVADQLFDIVVTSTVPSALLSPERVLDGYAGEVIRLGSRRLE